METDIKPIIEAILFSSQDPVSPESLKKVFPSVPLKQIKEVLEELVKEYEEGRRGFFVRRVGGGYQFRTKSIYAEWIKRFHEVKPQKLSRSALEVLAIVAYRQPITKPEIESIRGVDSSGAIKTLLDKQLIKPAGRKDVPGRPIMYVTTKRFLEVFSLNSLEDLPPLKEEDVERAKGGESLQSLFSDLNAEEK